MSSSLPSVMPSSAPTATSSSTPSSSQPTPTPSISPSTQPSVTPTSNPSIKQSTMPSQDLSHYPSGEPTSLPNETPSVSPTVTFCLVPSLVKVQVKHQLLLRATFQAYHQEDLPTIEPSMQPSICERNATLVWWEGSTKYMENPITIVSFDGKTVYFTVTQTWKDDCAIDWIATDYQASVIPSDLKCEKEVGVEPEETHTYTAVRFEYPKNIKSARDRNRNIVISLSILDDVVDSVFETVQQISGSPLSAFADTDNKITK